MWASSWRAPAATAAATRASWRSRARRRSARARVSRSALLVGTQLEPGLHLGLAGVGPVGGEPVAYGGVGLLLGRCLLGHGEPLGQFLGVGDGLVEGLLCPGRGGRGPFGLARGGAGLTGEAPELLGDGGLLPVGAAAPFGQVLGEGGLFGAEPGGVLLGGGEFRAPRVEPREFGGGLVHLRLDLQEAGRAGGAAVGVVRPEDVAVPGDRDDRPVPRPDDGLRLGQPVDDHHAVEQRPQRVGQVGGGPDQVHQTGRVRGG